MAKHFFRSASAITSCIFMKELEPIQMYEALRKDVIKEMDRIKKRWEAEKLAQFEMKIGTEHIKDIVKDNNKASFGFYRAGIIYYTVSYNGIDYQFPVRLDDIGDATLMKEDKALMLMRYIRKAIEANEFVKAV